ncbi:aldose 1-epimerase family protein [Robinsoniella peoriensis]|uniref:Aldose 1-epimerase n=1 Tax=Robinsoniella peoriensis TaxID=180332 RepID=A0A4U8QD43_9FIRM|nr:aldose 1-epimerase family protein [Robinsoniella peoriensis]MDU7026202.1 aldose 1-epimerase family protein [Clostridiales bacterium]TLD03042.1 hypothetical protein DSM106044_00066 [Robinsoniella peoriensis]
MQKTELKKMGSIQQMAYVRNIEFKEGRACGMKAIQVKSGNIQFTAAQDKCLDIVELSYKGRTLNFLSKPGLQNRQHYDSSGFEAQRSIMGGLFFTCGTDNVGTPEPEANPPLPMHGSLRSTPAEHVCTDAYWADTEYHIRISGEMRQAQLFGENVVLRRTIETVLGSNVIHIHDEFENQSYEEVPFMLLYHCNAGYPLLDKGTVIDIPTDQTVLRGEDSQTSLNWREMEEPEDGKPEEVFFHQVQADEKGDTYAAVINKDLGLGLKVHFNKNQLPNLTQWKSAASGDYALGLEPCNCRVNGQSWEKKNNTLMTLKSGEKKAVDLKFEIIEL